MYPVSVVAEQGGLRKRDGAPVREEGLVNHSNLATE